MDTTFTTPQTVIHSFPGQDPVTVTGVTRIMGKAAAQAAGFRFAKGSPSTFGVLKFTPDGATTARFLPVDVTFCTVVS